jgi:cellulose synthase/poly-beta-1,6-N-acetylglucosamine synthase-like glycosyltransferase
MLVSILVNSYNYERFVGSTIESALRQTYSPIEVIVVDDGSSDNSWSVIQGFGDRIQAVRTPNGGQGSAYNEGFARSRGEFVLFLDSDDLLEPTAIRRCVDRTRADVSKVQFRLRLVDADSKPVGGFVPYQMHDGDVRRIVDEFGIYAGPPGSGNLYRRSAIESCFPLDPELWRRGGTDSVPFVATGLRGSVVSIDEMLGSYRLHNTTNARSGPFGNISASYREVLLREQRGMARMYEIFGREMSQRDPADLVPTPSNLRTRVLSWKLCPADHPYPDDSASGLIRLCWRAFSRWPGYGVAERSFLFLWFTAVLWSPRALARRVARLSGSGSLKALVKRLVSRPEHSAALMICIAGVVETPAIAATTVVEKNKPAIGARP